MKTFKKAIAIAMTLVFILSLVPFSAMAEDGDFKTVSLKFVKGQTTPINFGNTRTGDNYKSSWFQYGYSNGTYGIYFGSIYPVYAHIDFSGYEEILRNKETTISMTLKNRGKESETSYKINAFEIYLAPDSCDSIIFSDGTTFNQAIAVSTGFYDQNRPIFFSRSDATAVSSYSSGELDPSNVLNVIDENPENSILSLYMQGRGGSTRINNAGSTFISIRYNEKEIDNQAYVNDLAEELSWEKFSADSAGSVTEYPDLPLKYKGANITWTSSNPEIFNTETGVITQLRGEEAPVKLTASLSYTDFAGNTVTAEKDINITVASLEPTVKKVSVNLNKQIGVEYPDSPYPTQYTAYYYTSQEMYRIPESGKGDMHGFLKFDLSDSLKEVEAATEIALVLVNRNTASSTSSMVTVLSDRYDDWTKDITYNSAIDLGMYTDPGYGTAYGVTINKRLGVDENGDPISSATPYTSESFTKAIKDAVAANPDEGLVTFRISNRDWHQISMQGNPRIEITYYEEDLMTDDELKTAKKDKVQWSALTTQDIDNVVADLSLPATWYGAPVIWASSDESVISSSGEVTIGNETKEVTLTATIDDAVNTFKVTVPANKVAIKSERSHKLPTYNNGGANLNYSSAIVYANEDLNITPDVVIATYSADGETLLDVTVKENVIIKKGHTCVPSGYHYEFGNRITKAIVVDDITTLEPLGIAR